jgi:sarcosine oxidase subunit gamma
MVSPLAGWRLCAPGVTGVELPFVPQFTVRSPVLSVAPNTWAFDPDGRAVLWLGPDEWLVVGAAVPAGPGVVDTSAARTTILLSGPSVYDVLAHGCALDLAHTAGWCAQTTLARTGVIIWGYAPFEVRVLVRPSFARHLAAWLTDAALGLPLPFAPIKD